MGETLMRVLVTGSAGFIGKAVMRALESAPYDAIGFDAPADPSPLARHAIACPALPTCGLAITEAERILPSVVARLEAQLGGHRRPQHAAQPRWRPNHAHP
jgi:sulfite reductase beta subunit-like hemoprotein